MCLRSDFTAAITLDPYRATVVAYFAPATSVLPREALHEEVTINFLTISSMISIYV